MGSGAHLEQVVRRLLLQQPRRCAEVALTGRQQRQGGLRREGQGFREGELQRLKSATGILFGQNGALLEFSGALSVALRRAPIQLRPVAGPVATAVSPGMHGTGVALAACRPGQRPKYFFWEFAF
jgi:hypothetical protein